MSDPKPNPPAARYLPKRLLPLGIAQSSIILVAIVIFSMEWKNKAQRFHSFLIILSGIHISIVTTIVNNGPDFCNIFKGIANYIFPLFLPGSPMRTLMFHIMLNSVTNLSICLLTAFYLGENTERLEAKMSSNHWMALSLNLLILLLTCGGTFLMKMRHLMKRINLLMGNM